MTFKEKLYAALGDTWFSTKSVALWPWPALVLEWPKATLSWDDYRTVTAVIEPGDILLSREDAFLFSNMAIPGKYKHVAVYTGPLLGMANKKARTIKPQCGVPNAKPYDRTIVHAVSEGVVCQDFGELFFNCDSLMVVRAWRTEEEQHRIVTAAIAEIGRGYDFDFDKDDKDRMYCSELAAHCLMSARIEPPPTVLVRGSVLAFAVKLRRWMKHAYTADTFLRYERVATVGV